MTAQHLTSRGRHEPNLELLELLRDLFPWEDEHKLDESAVRSKFEELRAASEEADKMARNEGTVLAFVSGSLFSLCGQRRHWQSGHECLFDMARTMAADFGDGAKLKESLENHFLRRTVADWPKLFAQLQRERALAESGTEVSLNPIALIDAIQQVRTDEAPPGRLYGTFPEGSPAAKRVKAAKKAVETKAVNEAAKVAQEQEKEEMRRANQPRKPELKDWLAWALSTGKLDIIPASGNCFRIVWPKNEIKLTQEEIASKLSFVLETSIAQQRIPEMRKKVTKWLEACLPEPDFAQWVEDPNRKEFTFKELTKLIDSERQIFRPVLAPKPTN